MGDTGEKCLVTVDGTDFRIQEPKPFSTKWYSHKFRGPGIRYELVVCIKTGWIVAYNGPFPCGRWPDIKIFRSMLKQRLYWNEKVIADRGYRGDSSVCHPGTAVNGQHRYAMSVLRARHETINGRLKTWTILKNVFRHDITKHHIVFGAIAVIEQIKIQNGRPPFQAFGYVDPR